MQLAGTGLVADDLYLMAHDDVTGRSFLQPRAVGLGLAGGLLAELLLPGAIRVGAGLLVTGDPVPLSDELDRVVLRQITSQHEPYLIRNWLPFLARTATDDVGTRLEQAGYLVRTHFRRFHPGRWVPYDSDCAFTPLVRARSALEATGKTTIHGTVLAGLAVACGLGPRLLSYGPPEGRRNLDAAMEQLPSDVRELIAQVEASVASAVLAHRL